MHKTHTKFWHLRIALSATLLYLPTAIGATPLCDPEQGQRLFSKCAACHSLEAGLHKMGPSLHNIQHRKAGSSKNYRYSMAMQQSDIVWNRENLLKFIESPMQYIPGTSMPFGGLRNSEDRQALLCHLMSSQH